jgi:cysteine-rich repeat protein
MHQRKAYGLILGLGLALAAPGCGNDESNPTAPSGDAGEGGESGEGNAPAEGGDDAGGGGSGPVTNCTPLKLGPAAIYLNIFGEVNGVKYPVLTPIGDKSLPEYLLIELLDSTTQTPQGFLPPLKNGAYDLSKAPDTNVNSCQHCVSLVTDVTEGYGEFLPIFQPAGWFFQKSGTLELTAIHDPVFENPAFAGSLARVELAQIDLEDPLQPFVDGGRCYYVDSAEFDKTTTPGKDCLGVDDCGNELLEICDPKTQRCVDESQCNIDAPCEDVTDFCIQQADVSQLGACYQRCQPFKAGACEEGRTCVQYGVSEHDGYCLASGDGEVGDACKIKGASTSCANEAVCWEGTCRAQCGFFSGAPGCDANACDVLGHCMPEEVGRPVELGEKCGAGSTLAQGCALNGNRFDGICVSAREEDPLLCEKSCYADENDYDHDEANDADDGADDPDCAEEEFCAMRFTSYLGVCKPDPVCGDGERGEVAEKCDDHNTTSGDGCSADCKTVEYDVLCAAAPVLDPDGSVEGTTVGGLDGFLSVCQQGYARGHVYSITPPGPGQLELTLTSKTRQLMALRGDCADVETERICGVLEQGQPSGSLAYQVTDATPAKLTLLINALNILEEGAFELTSEFTPQVCGDGKKVGAEACDDGNTEPNDGCAADCLAIEYDYWCDNATALTSGKKVSADIGDDAQLLFAPSCGYGIGRDHLYRFTATKAGTLNVSLNQVIGDVETNLALSIIGSCSPAAEDELSCSGAFSPTEELSQKVTKGQTVYINVDSLFATSGKYELTATLQ